ncbi:MAG: sugar ABC transporter substrate-binding protein [Spirochaetales bacterium]|nr:sugar ABC transporter substrate-binding protein [Spirochaetales bacterium]
MKNGLKFLGIIIVFTVLHSLSVFAGGQEEAKTAKASGTVTFMMWGGATEKQVVQGYLAPFLAKNPGIKVEISTPPNYGDVLQTMVAGGTPPDVCYLGFPEFAQYLKAGQLLDLQKYADKSKIFDKNDFSDAHLASFSDRKTGDLYSIPKDWSTYVVYYNDDMFRKAGLPSPLELYNKGEWTMDKFIEVAQKLTTDKTYGLLFNQGRWKAFVPYFAPNWIKGVDKLDVNTPQFISAVKFVDDLTKKYKINPSVDQFSDISPADRFSQQKGAMYIIGRWMTMRYIKSDLPFKWNVVPMPKKNGKAHTWVDMVGYAVMKDAKNPDAAWKVIEYLTGPEGQAAVARSGHAIPIRLSIANSDIFLNSVRPGFNNEAFVAIKDAAPILVFNNFVKIFYDTMGKELNNVFTGRKTAETACAELQKKIDKLLKE